MPITYYLPQHWLYAEEEVEIDRRVLLLLWPNKRNILVPRGSQLINHWSFWIHPTVNINQIHLALWNVLTILSPPANWEPMRYSHSNRYPSLFSVRFDSVAEDKHVSIQGTYSSTSALALFAFLARGYVDTRTRGRTGTDRDTYYSFDAVQLTNEVVLVHVFVLEAKYVRTAFGQQKNSPQQGRRMMLGIFTRVLVEQVE